MYILRIQFFRFLYLFKYSLRVYKMYGVYYVHHVVRIFGRKNVTENTSLVYKYYAT